MRGAAVRGNGVAPHRDYLSPLPSGLPRPALFGLCHTFRLGVQAELGSPRRPFSSFEIPIRLSFQTIVLSPEKVWRLGRKALIPLCPPRAGWASCGRPS